MSKSRKVKLGYGLFLLLLMGLFASCKAARMSESQTRESSSVAATAVEPAASPPKNTTPTLFIHGYKGGRFSFSSMLRRLEKDQLAEKALELSVTDEGTVVASGTLEWSEQPQMIQVLFQDNTNNEWNQADWIKACLSFLQQNYQVTTVNLVGHSMGGVSSLRYLTAYGSDTLPQVAKFVALGAPFNEFEEAVDDASLETVDANGPDIQTARYAEYAANIQNYPVSADFLTIAGDLQDGSVSDGTVPVASALGVDALLRNHGVNVAYELIEGQGGQHSQLHENPAVDQRIAEFLWPKK